MLVITLPTYRFHFANSPLFLAPMAFFTPHSVPSFKFAINLIYKHFAQLIQADAYSRINGIVNKIFHVRTPFVFSFLFGSPNAFFKESQIA